MLEEGRFRDVMGHFATGVSVVTSIGGKGDPVGLTVSALTSVSLQPILLLICIHKDAESHDEIIRRGIFAVNILSAHQGALALHFAGEPAKSRFRGIEVESAPLGSPLLTGCLAWAECRIKEVWSGGDHSVILGEVHDCEAHTGAPLLFFRSQLKGLTS